MGDILKEWLGSTVERELGIALELWGRNNSFDSDADKYDDDGTTLRIKLFKGHPVQIIKVFPSSLPATYLVSNQKRSPACKSPWSYHSPSLGFYD